MSENCGSAEIISLAAAAAARRADSAPPMLVMIDVQREHLERSRPLCLHSIESSLFRCAQLLRHARRQDWDVAHVVWRQKADLFDERGRFSDFIDGFHPRGHERVFVKSAASAYSNGKFAALMEERRGHEVFIAGYQGPSACLATLVDGNARGHRHGFVADASLSPRGDERDENAAHRRLVAIARQYAQVHMTEDLVARAQSREGADMNSRMHADRGQIW